MTLVIQACPISQVLGSTDLLLEYAAESAIKGLPPPSARLATYLTLEKIGSLVTFGAFVNENLLGFITVLSPVLPHYSVPVSVSESFFVAKAHRGTGAGLRLLHTAEKYVENAKSLGLLVSAPVEGSLIEVLPRVGYTEVSRVFFRGVKNV